MSEVTIYWRGWTESQLAAYQQNQGSTNHCAKYATATVYNLLYETDLSGDILVSWLNTRLLRGTFRYTIFGNQNGSLVFQTANLIRKLGQLQNNKPEVKCHRGNVETLQDSLRDGGALTLVSVTYLQGKEPVIARGINTASTLAASRWVGGHIMILGAYDHGHHNQEGTRTPWGFLSSWTSKDQLYWMTDEDFKRSWGRLSILNMVTVRM
ncbi:MAG: hypothetical protein HQ574_08085 [Chloroflexi bacterium]|nr:hypothetical protein [Chloroflexota bacterium]